MRKNLLLVFLFLILSTNFARAQETSDDDTPIKVETLLLTMPLTVNDNRGRNIAGLRRENFSIFQNGAEQEIDYFFNEEAPMNVAILIDASASTKKVLGNIQKAARDFVKVLRPEDKGIIVSFDYQTKFLSDLTADKKRLSSAINQVGIADKTGSDMNEAVFQVIKNHFESFKGRKAIIVLTDGMVVKRAVTSQQAMDALQNSDTFFYPIIFTTKSNAAAVSKISTSGKKPMSIEILEIIAQETAGKFYVKDAENLKEAFQNIAEELKNQYLLGFYPQSADSKNLAQDIRIEVNQENLNVRTKKRWKINKE